MTLREVVEERAKEIMEDNDIDLWMIEEVVDSVMIDMEHNGNDSNIDRCIWDAMQDWDLV